MQIAILPPSPEIYPGGGNKEEAKSSGDAATFYGQVIQPMLLHFFAW
jgi:hypothetical protein